MQSRRLAEAVDAGGESRARVETAGRDQARGVGSRTGQPPMTRLAACLILLWVLVEDMRFFRVRNLWVAALVACFVLDCLTRNRVPVLLPHALFAALGFALMAGAFVLRAVGGGDAKLLSAALLWVGPEGCFAFALVLGVCTLAYAAGARFGRFPARRIGGRTLIPFGPSIAAAWIAAIGTSVWG